MAEKPQKKVGTRKTPDGAQQYTSPKLARDPKMIQKLIKKGAKSSMVGDAAHIAFMQYGVRDIANKESASRNAAKRVGKPRGGR